MARTFNGTTDKINCGQMSAWAKRNEVYNNGSRTSHAMPFQCSNGDIIVGFCTNEDGAKFNVKLVRSTDGGATWGGKVLIDGTGSDADHFDVAFAQTATHLVAVYINGTAIEVKRSTDQGATWGTAIAVGTGLNSSEGHPCITKLANGNLLAFYADASADIVVKTSTDNGATWSGAVTVAGDASLSYIDPSSVMLANGSLICAFLESGNCDVYITRSTDSGATWSTPRILVGLLLSQANDPNLTVLQNGDLICWVTRNADLSTRQSSYWLSHDGGVSWLYESLVADDSDPHRINGIQLTDGSMMVVCTSRTGGDADYHIDSMTAPANFPFPSFEDVTTFAAYAWIRYSGTSSGNSQFILSKNGSNKAFLYVIDTGGTTNQIATTIVRAGSTMVYQSVNDVIADATWTFVAASVDYTRGAGNFVKLFAGTTPANFAEVARSVSTDGSGNFPLDHANGGTLTIGGRDSDNLRGFNGDVAFPGLGGRALNINELRGIMARTMPKVEGLAAHYPLWGNDSPELTYVANGRTGTLAGTTKTASNPPVCLN